MKISKEDQQLYDKIKLLSSISSPHKKKQVNNLSDSDLYEICQYSRYSIIKLQEGLIHKLSAYKDKKTGNSCLHIAAISSNKDLVVNLVEKNIIDASIINKNLQNPLMSTLALNEQPKGEKIAAFLTSKIDDSSQDIQTRQ